MSDRPLSEDDIQEDLLSIDEILQEAWDNLPEYVNMTESELLALDDDTLMMLFSEQVGVTLSKHSRVGKLIDFWCEQGYNSDWITLRAGQMYWDEDGEFTDNLQARIYGRLKGHALQALGWVPDGNGSIQPYGGWELNGWTKDVHTDTWISPEGKTITDVALDYYRTHTYRDEDWDMITAAERRKNSGMYY